MRSCAAISASKTRRATQVADTPQHPAAFEYPPLHGGKLLFLTAAIATTSFMEILDMTIVNVSVPSISGSLGVSTSEGTWAVSSYMLAAAVMQPLTGWIGRRFGEVRTLVTSICLFMVFSALCGLATSMPMLVAARLIQGLVSGPMMSVAQAILLRNYPIERRGMAIALWAMVIVIAPIFGPIIGGWITDNISWPWIFYINLPVGAFAAAASWMLLRHRESKKVKLPIDGIGLGLLAVGVGCLQFMLDNGNDKDWFNSTEILLAAMVSFVCIAFLIPWELTDKHPVIDLYLFKRRNFRVGTMVVGVAYFGLSAVNIIFPLWLQTTLGYTATRAGLAVAPIGLLALIASPIVGRNMNRMNLRLAASFAFCVFGSAVRKHRDGGIRLDVESPHRLPSCGPGGARAQLGAGLDELSIRLECAGNRRQRSLSICGPRDRRTGRYARGQRRFLCLGMHVHSARSLGVAVQTAFCGRARRRSLSLRPDLQGPSSTQTV